MTVLMIFATSLSFCGVYLGLRHAAWYNSLPWTWETLRAFPKHHWVLPFLSGLITGVFGPYSPSPYILPWILAICLGLALLDYYTHLLPDLWTGTLAVFLGFWISGVDQDPLDYLWLYAFFYGGTWYTMGSLFRKYIGFGDMKLIAAATLALPLSLHGVFLFLSVPLGFLMRPLLRLDNRKDFCFGPCLLVSLIICLCFYPVLFRNLPIVPSEEIFGVIKRLLTFC